MILIRKEKLAWPNSLKYALFALCGMPAKNLGYSIYEIVFGKRFPSPLALLYDSWLDKQDVPVNLNAWLDQFDKNVKSVKELIQDMPINIRKKYKWKLVRSCKFFNRKMKSC